MDATQSLPAFLGFVPAEVAMEFLGNLSCFPLSTRTIQYKELWGYLVTLQVPGHHIEILAAILAMQALYEGSVNYDVSMKIMDHTLTSDEIKALRECLPRLPSELNIVLRAHKMNSTCSTICIPALPFELDAILAPSNDLATAIRHTLKVSTILPEDQIMPTNAEMLLLRAELSGIPDYLGYQSCISATKVGKACDENLGIRKKLQDVYNIRSYGAWFAARNALCLAESLPVFLAAVNALEDSEVKTIYLQFYNHFMQAGFPRLRLGYT